jgi:hypothetical protein
MNPESIKSFLSRFRITEHSGAQRLTSGRYTGVFGAGCATTTPTRIAVETLPTMLVAVTVIGAGPLIVTWRRPMLLAMFGSPSSMAVPVNAVLPANKVFATSPT